MAGTATKSKLFAIGDVHGCAAELRALLAQLPIDPGSTVVFLGDYVDRGPDSKGVVDQIIALGSRCRVIALRGNHEDMMIEFLERPESVGAALFVLNGGSATLASYSDGAGGFAIPERHRRFFLELRLFWESERHFFVHAGVPDVPLAELDVEKHGELMQWIRTPFLKSRFQWEKTIVHGHSPVDRPDLPGNRINLDTGCVFGNRLTALELNSMTFYSVQRAPDAEPTFLRDPDRARIAARFTGVAPVFLIRGGRTVEFETLNYNEFGLLIQEKAPSHGARASGSLEVGESVVGWIGAPGSTATPDLSRGARVDFEGSVVRTESRGEFALYGVRMTRMRSDHERAVDGIDYGAGRGLRKAE